MKNNMSKFETYKSWNEYRWRLVTNWKIVWSSSEWFHDEDYCIENAKKVMIWIHAYMKENNKLGNQAILKPKGISLPKKQEINLFDFK